LHSGGLHILATLLRRVLLRAARLGMFGKKPEQDLPLWQVYEPREKSEDELLDMHATKQSAPNHIPALITKACCSVVNSCCGPVQEKGRRWKRPTLSLFIRRASDIALTAIFGFAMDMDLWGNDMCACASIMKEIVDRYCSEGFDSDNNAEIAEKFDVGYGRMLRSEISVQHLLDNIRMRFGEEIILSKRSNSEICDAKQSVATSLSRLLYMLLKYSLSSQKTIPQGEHDVISAVNALSDCQLGSVGSHAILTAINDVLVFCETFPLNQAESVALPETDVQAISAVLYSHHFSNPKQKSRDACFKLKAMKTDIIGRLARNLIIGQFHDVLAPLLLSRTIFTGSAESTTSNSKNDVIDGNCSRYHWQHHWRIVLRLFTWLVSVAGSKGEEAAKAAGALILQSGEAGSLHQCFVTNNRMELMQLVVMPLPTATSAVPPGFNSDRSISESHLLEMCYRLKTMLYLSGGLTSALLSQNRVEHTHLTRATVETVSTLTNILKTLTCFTLEKNYDLMTRQGTVSGRQRRGSGAVIDKSDVRAALELGPPLIATMILFEEKLDIFRNRQRSSEMDSWDFVEEGAVDIDPPVEEQIKVLISCQEEMSALAGILIARAMIAGGGEASTLVWRAIIASFDSTTTDSKPVTIFGDDGIEKPSFTRVLKEGRSSLRTNLLCRLISIVIDLILYRREDRKNPWTSIELCSAIARLCDLVEEKNLLSIESSTGTSQEI
jgi:hypothetical protein